MSIDCFREEKVISCQHSPLVYHQVVGIKPSVKPPVKNSVQAAPLASLTGVGSIYHVCPVSNLLSATGVPPGVLYTATVQVIVRSTKPSGIAGDSDSALPAGQIVSLQGI